MHQHRGLQRAARPHTDAEKGQMTPSQTLHLYSRDLPSPVPNHDCRAQWRSVEHAWVAKKSSGIR